MFVIGVADVDVVELKNIGSKPSDRHVFVVDDFDAFTKIQDNLITFICETATSSKTLLSYFIYIETMMTTESMELFHTMLSSVFSACPLIYLDGFTTPGKNEDRKDNTFIPSVNL